MYVDYEFYKNTFGGRVLEIDFTRLEIQASSIVDYYTFNRIKEVDTKIKLAVCELIDYLKQLEDNGGKEISSESVGDHSVSYVTEDTTTVSKKQRDIVKRYLGNTGLMYRGRYNED